MEFVIVSGMSGAGKSTVVSFMEDMGFYCIDNLPAPMVPKFAELCMANAGKYERVALVCDIRGGQTFDGLFEALEQLKEMHCEYKILFTEATPAVIVRRYKETRRSHPLGGEGISLTGAVEKEKAALEPVRRRADYIIDTTGLSTAKLKGEVVRLFGDINEHSEMSINVLSFGFKYGLPIEADLVFDVRFLPNPYYIAELKEKTGLDEAVRSFLSGYRQTQEFMEHLKAMTTFLLPSFEEEGKSALVIAIGCTGGQHRSVAVAHALAEFIGQKGYSVSESHRDMTRKKV